MEIVESKHIEDCFDGSYVYEISFSEPVGKPVIDALAQGSQLQYYPDFARPFFRIKDERFMMKGVQENRTVRIVIFQSLEETLEVLEDRIGVYHDCLSSK